MAHNVLRACEDGALLAISVPPTQMYFKTTEVYTLTSVPVFASPMLAVVEFNNSKLVNSYVFSQFGSKATNSASLAAMSDIDSSAVSKPLREPRRGLTSRRAS